MNEYTSNPLYLKQLELEAKYKNLGEISAQRTITRALTEKGGDITRTKLGQAFISHQFEIIRNNIKTTIEQLLLPKKGVKPTYVNILAELINLYEGDADTLFDIITLTTLTTTFNMTLRGDTHHSNIASAIAKELHDEITLYAYTKKHPNQTTSILKGVDDRIQALYKRAYMQARLKHDNFTYPKWQKENAIQMTATFLQILLATSNYFDQITTKGGNKIIPSQALLEAFKNNADKMLLNVHQTCPTIIKPRQWQDLTQGGYWGELQNKHTLIRLHSYRSIFSKRYIQKLNQIDLSSTLTAINALQNTPWRINKQILEILNIIVQKDLKLAGVPSMQPIEQQEKLKDPTNQELQTHKAKAVVRYKQETIRKSVALRVLSHLRYAEDFKDFDNIYFPCNMDFRGRLYPIPAFNFQGDDINKSLLLFANVPPLDDENKLKWFYITGANLAGIDKVSFDERIAWIKKHHTQIIKSAQDPIGYTFWADLDSPCQFLAFCFEYQTLQEHIKKHKTAIGFTTGLPIAFDGTCSGLQHFSAILRDPIGASAVNLTPTDSPQDIYRIVADKVNTTLKQDAITGTKDTKENYKDKETSEERPYTKYGTRTLAQLWLTFGVNRKVTKRSVMTLAYGSKQYGFSEQLLEDTIYPDINKNPNSLFNGYAKQAAKYLARLIWEAVKTTVVKAVEAMKWLQECAKLATKDMHVVSWTTPMGLPIQQTYMLYDVQTIKLRCSGKQLRLYLKTNTGNVDKKAQTSGIAPNFIHSMDASHLQMTILNSISKGINHFSMIHDSYAAPLNQAGQLFNTIRESFYQMYTQTDVLENFKKELEQFSKTPLPKLPQKGSLDLKEVLNSQYIFS